MSRQVEYFLFDPQYPEIVVTSATPRGATFNEASISLRRSRSQETGLLRVPKSDVEHARARDPNASPRSLRRSPSSPTLARFIQFSKSEKIQRYAAKAPWTLEGKPPVRLDLSLWKSKKSKLQTEVFNVIDVPSGNTMTLQAKFTAVSGVDAAEHIGETSRSADDFVPKKRGPSRRLAPPELPTVLIEMNMTAKERTSTFKDGKRKKELRSLEDDINGDTEATESGSVSVYEKGAMDN